MAIFRRIISPDAYVQKLQDELEVTFRQLEQRDFISGVFVRSVAIATGQDNYVDHGLGRRFQGYTITRKDSAGDVYESDTTNLRPELQIILKSSATCVVNLYVF